MLKGFVFSLLGLWACSNAFAFERLSDSASPRAMVAPQSVLTERSLPPDQDFSDYNRLDVNYGRIEYRLNTSAYLGQDVRIYFVMPNHVNGMMNPQALRALWDGDGRFAGGAAYLGEQVLVWQGIVREPMMNAALNLRYEIRLDGFALPSRQGEGLEPYFVIERVR